MSSRRNAFRTLALAIPLLLGTGSAQAAKGQFSIGGNFGVGFYSGGSFNDSLAARGYKKVDQGLEYGGSLRYGVSPRASLDFEVLSINGKGTTKTVTPKYQAEINGIATALSLYYELSQSDNHALNLFAGAGPLFKTGWSTKQDPAESTSRTKQTFYAQAGLEGQLKAGKHFAIATRFLGRIAKAKRLEDSAAPAIRYDVSMNGFAVGLGLRAFFGGSGD